MCGGRRAGKDGMTRQGKRSGRGEELAIQVVKLPGVRPAEGQTATLPDLTLPYLTLPYHSTQP